ncbi:phosphatidylethanolamine N-methyltransferase /phosphatidyl-N-methylethanolamine N-methyltransferase [Pontibacter ummariensis]|uniref:Phosphatidylethanolamine N-methyltransferase /phosphatidyl-N-methylethanolamine N-methyltransferase n=1 Tax=Pontibacter ummariensis TaxID=1610492 RepID=A0A239EU90_9BACT|nr:methyltransferase domain-containing protein [Pontibacter ummariensis]PRY12745.1 phosphatidylethanolamine N-methyltransferase /phosphatidyl-N-methylethanolamine N-methyltransferase [Pontibacter ummariensis]SNS48167.1 phosphatidylethanolamine N-methyltransferase /phosphatidyl-N-methylethanolamine N-methyltransferase [Pontibacter ummariensis]
MSLNTNTWNRLRYTLYLPVYDLIADRVFRKYRKRSIQLLSANPTEAILLLGAGTGLDLPYLKGYTNLTAIDITPGMITKLKQRAEELGIPVQATVMNGEALRFANASFDAVVLHLILAVIPDPVACIKEVERVLKPGGAVVVFDKFLPDGTKPSPIRHLLNQFASTLFSDINRSIGKIISYTALQPELNEPAAFGGTFRIVRLRKP